jgi:hypothetical protein
LAVKRRQGRNRRMDAGCQSRDIRITGTRNDPGMVGVSQVQFTEVAAIVSQNCPPKSCRTGQNIGIRNALTGTPIILGCQHIVPQCTELIDRGLREIFVSVKVRHERSVAPGIAFIPAYGVLNLIGVFTRIVPRCVQIFLRQGGVERQQLGVADSKLSIADENPDRNPRATKARFPAHHIWPFLNPHFGRC